MLFLIRAGPITEELGMKVLAICGTMTDACGCAITGIRLVVWVGTSVWTVGTVLTCSTMNLSPVTIGPSIVWIIDPPIGAQHGQQPYPPQPQKLQPQHQYANPASSNSNNGNPNPKANPKANFAPGDRP